MASEQTAERGLLEVRTPPALDTDNSKDSRWPKMKNICIAFAVVVAVGVVAVAVAIAFLIVNWKKQDECKLAASEHGKLPCPPGWIWYNGKCYYFSVEEGNWTASQAFCSSYNASLAIIEKGEMKFVLRYKGIAPHWIGFRRDPKRPWKWTDGNNSTLEVIGDGGDCAFLNGDATASSSRCSTAHHWICSKPDGFTHPKMA
ncbi:C-type lectin domain family 2 member B-like [Liasis olivaceus]